MSSDRDSQLRVAEVFHEDRYSGPIKRVSSAWNQMLESGVEETLILPDRGGNAPDILRERQILIATLKISRIPNPRRVLELLLWIIKIPVDVYKFVKAYASISVETVIINTPYLIAAAVAARISGRNVVWCLNDTLLPRSIAHIYGYVLRFTSAAIIAQGDALGRHFGLETNQYCRIYSHVDSGKLSKYRSPHGEDGDSAFVVGMVANWNWMKGHEDFVRAAHIVRMKVGEPVRFVIVGAILANQMPYYRRIRGLIESLQLEDVIDITGFVSDPYPCMSRFSVTVLASRTGDACSNVVLESMAMGIPVVGKNVGCTEELLVSPDIEPAGRVVMPGDPSDMAEEICNILSDNRLRHSLGTGGISRAEKRFDTRIYVREYEKLVQNLAN